MRHGRTAGLLALVLGLVLLSTYWLRLRLNLSPSVPSGLYRLTTAPAELHRGALVVLPVPASIQPVWPSWVPLLKPVAGIAGDRVCHDRDRLSVAGRDYGPVFLEAHGQALPQLDTGCQLVPVGMVFLASQAPNSLDGRYFNMTPIDTISAQAIPVLTWRSL